ncbi:MAG: DUF2782 domain-containing protein [Gammaproteobacteria bacterium]|nr:DUF2782 domain-containing protein [Gammaproteobacteria bacterium]
MLVLNSSIFAGLVFSAFAAYAAGGNNLQNVPEAAPASPPSIEDGQSLEPDVTIVQRKDATIEEYRMNGRLYMIKVVPIVGKPYYLMDRDGDGLMESKISDLYKDPIVPQWVILSW